MNNYTIVDKIFHNFIFSNKFIQKSLYEFHRRLFKNADNFNQNHIFITGLPRSGSTVLLYFFYKTELFASLTYRDMPFVISPRLNFFSKKNINKKERLHKDGLKFDLDTPEALDNVFFRIFDEQEINLELENYIGSILTKYKKKRYLSKNNNILEKLDLIIDKLEKVIILVPFREPKNQSYSLYKQHLNFIELHKKDKFSLKYMNDLGHFEFGNNHQSWFEPLSFSNPLDINYWLEQWFIYYTYIFEKYKKNRNFLFISYEKFCDKVEYRNKILEYTSVPKEVKFDIKNNNLVNDQINLDLNLLNKCQNLYLKLNEFF